MIKSKSDLWGNSLGWNDKNSRSDVEIHLVGIITRFKGSRFRGSRFKGSRSKELKFKESSFKEQLLPLLQLKKLLLFQNKENKGIPNTKNKSKEYKSLLLYDILAASDCLWLLLPKNKEKQRKQRNIKHEKQIKRIQNIAALWYNS